MAHSPTPAVIFDLDGTLVDSEPNYHEAAREVLAHHGVPGFSWREHQEFIGIGTRETLHTLRERYALTAPVEQLLREKNEAYLRLARRGTQVFPRMRTLVELLHGAGHRLIVASGSSLSAIETVLEGTGLLSLLPDFVSAEEVAHGKPEPDVFLEAARRLGLPPHACAVVEDATPGVLAARRAGMRRVFVPYGGAEAGDSETGDTETGDAAEQLVFAGGQRDFDARVAYDWLRRPS